MIKETYNERVSQSEGYSETKEDIVSLKASMDKLFAMIQSQQDTIASLQNQLAKVTEQISQPSQEEKKPEPVLDENKQNPKQSKKAWGDWRKVSEKKQNNIDR